MTRALLAGCAATLGFGCAPSATADGCPEGESEPVPVAVPQLDAPCALDPADASRLLITTTDFATGAVSVFDTRTQRAMSDVAAGTTDAIPAWHNGRALIIHRYQYDYLQLLDPTRGWATVGEFSLEPGCAGPANPQGIAFGPDDRGYVSQLGDANVAILDLSAPSPSAELGEIDLSAFDGDGNPEAALSVACGSTLWVAINRLDAQLARKGPDELIAIDLVSSTALDLDPKRPGPQGLRSAGTWVRQLRRDPLDPASHTLLALSTGIERFDLAAGTVRWAVAPERFAAAGLGGPQQLQSFAVAPDGRQAAVAAYDADFAQVQLYMIGLDDHEPGVATAFADAFDSVERTLEWIGDRLYYASRRHDAPGIWVFDATADLPTVLAGPIATGLPPYSVVAIP